MPNDVGRITLEVPQHKLLRAYSLALEAHRPVQRRGATQVTCLACHRPWPCPAQVAAQALAGDATAGRGEA